MPQALSKNIKKVMRIANSIHVALYRISGGKVANRIANMPVLLITTYGRKTGKPHTNPVVYLRDGQDYLVSASMGGMDATPAWYFNLKSHPDIQIKVGDQSLSVRAMIVNSEERDQLYAKFKAASPNFVKYEKTAHRVIPVIRLTPQSEAPQKI